MEKVSIIILIVVGSGFIAFHSHIARFVQKVDKAMYYDSPFSMRLNSHPKFLFIIKILYLIIGIVLVIVGILLCFGVL